MVTATTDPAGGLALGRSLAKVLWDRKWLVATLSTCGLILGIVYYAQHTKLYRSYAQILVMRRASPIQKTDGKQTLNSYEDMVTDDVLATHMMVLGSETVVSSAVRDAHLDRLHSFAKVVAEGDSVVDEIISNLTLEKGGKGQSARYAHVLTIKYDGPVPEHCKIVVDAIIAAYQKFLDGSSKNVGKTTEDLITRANTDLELKLKNLQDDYERFRRDSPLIWSDESSRGLSVHRERMSQIEKVRAEAQVQAGKRKAELETIQGLVTQGDDPEAVLLTVERLLSDGDPTRGYIAQLEPRLLTDLKIELATLERMREGTAERYNLGPDHNKLKAFDRQIEVLRARLKREGANVDLTEADAETPAKKLERFVSSYRQEIAALEARDAQLAGMFEKERIAARSQDEFERKDGNFRFEIDRTRKMLDAVAEKLEEISLTKDERTFDARVIAPTQDGYQIAPRLLTTVVLLSMIGFMSGCGLAYAVELADKSFRGVDDVRTTLGLPLVGQIPMLPAPRSMPMLEGSPVDRTLRTWHRPQSPLAESYRAVRTALYFSTRGSHHSVIQITSPVPGDGKSTLAANLAVAIAQSGKKVLLIDADFRKPRVHKLFGIDDSVGMSSVIDGEAEIEDALQKTELENLYLMPCGPIPPNPSELLSSARFQELLETLRDQFSFVIVDTPPLLAVSDPSAVAPRVDGVILTLKLRKNGRPLATRAHEILENVGAKVLGVVVTAVGKQDGYGYGYGYGYGEGATEGGLATGPHSTRGLPKKSDRAALPLRNGD